MQLKLLCTGFLVSFGASLLAIGAEPHDTPDPPHTAATIGSATARGTAACLLPIADPAIGDTGIAAPKLAADPKTFDRSNIISAFVAEVEKNHITHRPLDDRQAAVWFDRFLGDLDPQRMYFLQSDVAQFQPLRGQILGLARHSDSKFLDQVRQQYAKRVQEACSYAANFLATKQDFSVDEEFPRRYTDYAPDGDGLRERWRLRIKAELLIEKVHGTKAADAKAWLTDRYRRIAKQAREMSDERLCEVYLNALGHVCDPHTAWISPREIAAITGDFNIGHFTTGISFPQHEGRRVITDVDSRLAGRGTQQRLVGWELLAIQRLDGTRYDVVEMPDYDFMQLIRSPLWALGDDGEVILELVNPVSLDRRTVSWVRLKSF